MNRQRLSYIASEAIGTFVMMFIGIGAIALNFGTSFMTETVSSPSWRLLITGLMFAGGATLVVYSPVGRISGAHLNPAVSLAFFLEGRIRFVDFAIYSIVQTIGSFSAAKTVAVLWAGPVRTVRFGMTLPGTAYSIPVVFLTEVGITFVLITLIFFMLHRKKLTPFAGLAAGFLVAALVYLTAPISGTSLNPARTLGPAIAGWDFSFIWIYLFAPFSGSIVAAAIHKMVPFLHSPLCAKMNHTANDTCLYNCEFNESKCQ